MMNTFEDKIYNFRNLKETKDNELVTVEETLNKVREYKSINTSKDICIINLVYRLNLKSNEIVVLRYDGDVDIAAIIFKQFPIEKRRGIIEKQIQIYTAAHYPEIKFSIQIDDAMLKY